jgi:hypothetical protein
MKNSRLFALFTFYFHLSVLQAQTAFPWWDYRSTAWLSGRFGIGYQFGNQNRHLYFFTETDLCASCMAVHFTNRPANLHEQLRFNQYRGNLHLKLQTSKDFKLYDTRFYRGAGDIRFKNRSWTYYTGVGASVDLGLYRPGKLADLEAGTLNDNFRRRVRLRIRHDIVSRYYSYYYRKLSNTVGYFNLNVSALDDRWGVNLNWGNDAFIFGKLRNFVVKHDHGETNSASITGYWRPLEKKSRSSETVYTYLPESLQKLELGVSLRMITDRNIHKHSSSNQARVGMYDILGLENSFHGYYGIVARAETGFYNLRCLIGKDDLKWGRDMQRFAHQGYRHLPFKWARRIWGNFIKGTDTPLFPWESQPFYYHKPRFYYELNADLTYPYARWF